MTYTEERSIHTNPAIDYFLTHSYIVNSSYYFLFVLYAMLLKRQNIWPPDVSTLDALNDTRIAIYRESC